ncbi:MAG TPA: methylmalonyl Co-A mutase-associated GTPase MeaB [Nitriliruptorales bacterium]|nr:methylmalonyl Co-A mutase-associated GTPase MeaB [Nitriliruptorales bacterium]
MARDRGVAELVDALGRGERRAVARLLTLVEDGGRDTLREVVARLHPRTGQARIIGITGSPGVGKSTLTDALAAELRARDRTVGVIAIDPSSPFTGGALLGDRVRMQSHHADPGVFIRSMAARGHLGGIAFATPHAVLVLDAAGFDDVIVETVGVGQSEVDVASTADTTVVCVAPGMGDAIQAAKAGILEVADVFAINKADHGGAGKTESELRSMLEMGHELVGDDDEDAGWWPPIVRAVAVRPEGVDELADALDRHHRHLVEHGALARRRRERARHAIREIATTAVRARFADLEADGDRLLDTLAEKVGNRDLDPYTAADQLLEAVGDRPVRSSDAAGR